jgi:hypothetical protein
MEHSPDVWPIPPEHPIQKNCPLSPHNTKKKKTLKKFLTLKISF